MTSIVDTSWLAKHVRSKDHQQTQTDLKARMPDANSKKLRSEKSIFEDPVPLGSPINEGKWLMDDYEPPPFAPPWPSQDLRNKMRDESAEIHPELPLGPLASAWIDDLMAWYQKLQNHFGFNPADLAANVRNSSERWARRLEFLRDEQSELHKFVMDLINQGHAIPFKSVPKRLFQKSNPPSLAADMHRAWTAVKGDIDHGAIAPVDIQKDGLPKCVCQVRTADKSDGSARFVHNTRHVNASVDEEKTKCRLETLLRSRNMYISNGYMVGSDFSSGYHCIYVKEEHQKYLAFALHVSELPAEAIKWLQQNFPKSYYHKKRCFIFKCVTLTFGMSSSCNAFSSLVTSLVAS